MAEVVDLVDSDTDVAAELHPPTSTSAQQEQQQQGRKRGAEPAVIDLCESDASSTASSTAPSTSTSTATSTSTSASASAQYSAEYVVLDDDSDTAAGGCSRDSPNKRRRKGKANATGGSGGGGGSPSAAAVPASSGGASDGTVALHNSAVFERSGYTCSVCLDALEQEKQVTKCGHIFHKKCIVACIKAHHKCPICQKKLTQRDHHPLFI